MTSLEKWFDDPDYKAQEENQLTIDEWVDMPEFVQEENPPFSKIIFRFATQEDLDAFSKLIGQKLTPKTKSAWYPELQRGIHGQKRWIQE
jgi:hypothetical protein